jgi:hypothetical protein
MFELAKAMKRYDIDTVADLAEVHPPELLLLA